MMSTTAQPADPLASAQHRARLLVAWSLVVAALTAMWAFWPLKVPSVPEDAASMSSPTAPDPASVATAEALDPSRQRLNLDAFNAPLWTVAQPPPPPVAPPAPPPLRLQLLGIDTVQHDGWPTYRAVLYDPDQDKVLVLASGDRVGPRLVQRVDSTSVALVVAPSEGDATAANNHPEQVLSLHAGDGRPTTSPPSRRSP